MNVAHNNNNNIENLGKFPLKRFGAMKIQLIPLWRDKTNAKRNDDCEMRIQRVVMLSSKVISASELFGERVEL